MVISLQEVPWIVLELERVAELLVDPPGCNYIKRQDTPICDPLQYIAITFESIM